MQRGGAINLRSVDVGFNASSLRTAARSPRWAPSATSLPVPEIAAPAAR